MRIAIIDVLAQDVGLKILFPEADYYIDYYEFDKTRVVSKYNINAFTDWNNITDKNYDCLFFITPLHTAIKHMDSGTCKFSDALTRFLNIIDNNDFKQVCLFDNYDYDYDPNDYVDNKKITYIFKRFYNKQKIYKENVKPFPFIAFGHNSIMEIIDNPRLERNNVENRVFFSGSLFEHKDRELSYFRDRVTIYNEISEYIYNPGALPHETFLNVVNESKFCLEINGVGDPNKRLFEILAQGSLKIGEFNHLKWPFEEDFCKETIFKNSKEFIEKINILSNNEELYNKCLNQQNMIFKKYFNKKWIKEYILSFLLD